MLPNNAISISPVISSFTAPLDGIYMPLTTIVMGGVALNDPVLGRDYQQWTAYYEASTIYVKPVAGAVEFSMLVEGVLTLSLAFDNNMGVVLAWMTSTGGKLYYYDTLTAAYVTREFLGIDSCRVCVDYPPLFFVSQSDVIFGYTKLGSLYWRQQRDRYDIERIVGVTVKKLIKMGPNIGNRLQFELR